MSMKNVDMGQQALLSVKLLQKSLVHFCVRLLHVIQLSEDELEVFTVKWFSFHLPTNNLLAHAATTGTWQWP